MKTLKVIICDDEKAILQLSEKLLQQYAQQQGLQLELHCFQQALECLFYLRNNSADLLLLDIFLDGAMGTELAARVREFNPEIKLVFLSTSNEFATESFEVNASYYLIKPLTEEKLTKAMARCFPPETKQIISIDTGRGVLNLDPEEVLVLEVQNKYTHIHTTKGIIDALYPLGKFAEYFKEPDFCMIHRSFIINFNQVQELEEDCFLMRNGFRAPIRTRGTKAVKDQYIQWLFDHM